MYKAKCCNEIYEKYIDQLRFCPDIETELEVKDTSHSEQNLSLHPVPHIIEPNQSNQTTTSPSSAKHYQITPPVCHYLNLLTTQYLLDQT